MSNLICPDVIRRVFAAPGKSVGAAGKVLGDPRGSHKPIFGMAHGGHPMKIK